MKFELNKVNHSDKLEAPKLAINVYTDKAEQKKATMWFNRDISRSSFRSYFQSKCAVALKKQDYYSLVLGQMVLCKEFK